MQFLTILKKQLPEPSPKLISDTTASTTRAPTAGDLEKDPAVVVQRVVHWPDLPEMLQSLLLDHPEIFQVLSHEFPDTIPNHRLFGTIDPAYAVAKASLNHKSEADTVHQFMNLILEPAAVIMRAILLFVGTPEADRASLFAGQDSLLSIF
ncbi:hypothetical protein C8J56DRAFT_483065 [Mycena floridula]|nr:hypothetical protein C8J56DRAFT_483065 [Mycena floridula]